MYFLFHCRARKVGEVWQPRPDFQMHSSWHTASQPCKHCRLMGNICTSRVNGLWRALLVVCESPCFAGRQDLVLPQRALTRGAANTEQHLKLWSCCPCRTFCQAALQITREFFFLFFLPETFHPSVCFLSIPPSPPLFAVRWSPLPFSFSCFVCTSTTSPNQ